MADSSIDITAGVGTTVDTRTESSNGNHRQVIVIGDPATNAGVAPVDGTLGLATYFATQPTISAVGNFVPAGGTLSVYQGTGTPAWRTTLATLPVVTNVTGYALESGGNLDSVVTTLNSIKSKTDNLDVTLGSRLGSGATLPITGTVSTLAAGGSLSAFQSGTWTVQPGNTPNTTAWLVTMATLPVVANVNVAGQATVTAIQGDPGTKGWLTTLATLPVMAAQVGNWSVLAAGGSLGAFQSGSWTVQPGNTPNTTAWLMTQATLPVVANINNPTLAVTQSGTWNVFSSLASGTSIVAGARYMPTLASLSSMDFSYLKHDLFSNLMVNTNVPLPNSTKLNRFYTLASMASLMAAPGSGKRLVVRELDYSGNATLAVKLVEDQGGTPVTVWGPHYFLPYAGVTKTQCYIPITSNKSLGVDMQPGGFNASIDLRVETENV